MRPSCLSQNRVIRLYHVIPLYPNKPLVHEALACRTTRRLISVAGVWVAVHRPRVFGPRCIDDCGTSCIFISLGFFPKQSDNSSVPNTGNFFVNSKGDTFFCVFSFFCWLCCVLLMLRWGWGWVGWGGVGGMQKQT